MEIINTSILAQTRQSTHFKSAPFDFHKKETVSLEDNLYFYIEFWGGTSLLWTTAKAELLWNSKHVPSPSGSFLNTCLFPVESGEVSKDSNHPSLAVKKKKPLHRFHKRRSSRKPSLDPSSLWKFFADEESVMHRQKPQPALFSLRGRKLFHTFESPAPTPSPTELWPSLPSPSRLWPTATAANKATCSIIAELHSGTLQLLTSAAVPSCFLCLIAGNTVLQLHRIKILRAAAKGKNCWQK